MLSGFPTGQCHLFFNAHQGTWHEASPLGHVAGRRSKTQPHQSATTPRSPGQEAFCGQWKTGLSPIILSVCVMVIWVGVRMGAQSDDRQTESLLTGDICAAFFSPPGEHCNTQPGGSGSQVADWEPQEATNTNDSSGHQFPSNLLNCDFQAKSSISPQLKSGKDYETTWVRKTKGVFCNFARNTSRTTPKFQMCSSWMKGVHKSALQLKKGNC